MGPELKAYEQSAHRNVACVECHTEPGVAGWIKAKVNGTRQLVQILTGTFPKPIPAPDHSLLPPTSTTCLKCHDVAPLVANGGPIKLVIHNRYRTDETVTRDSIALVLRPYGFGGTNDTRGVHWHIAFGRRVPHRRRARPEDRLRGGRQGRRVEGRVHRRGHGDHVERGGAGHRTAARERSDPDRWTASTATTASGTGSTVSTRRSTRSSTSGP